MIKLYFIRHGESEGNNKRLFTGRWDVPLTELGQAQARLAGQNAKSLGIDLIVTSPLIRAQETAQIIAREIDLPPEKIISSDLFMERDYGDLQQKPYSYADGLDFETVAHIETSPQLIERGKKAANFLNRLDAAVVLVSSHGTFGRILHHQISHDASGVIEVPIEQEIPNAEIVRWL